MPQESDVTLPGGIQTGQNVRTILVTTLINGVPTTVQIQVVAVADEFGNPFQFEHQEDWRREMLDELRAIRLGIQELLSAGALPGEAHDLLESARDMRTDPEMQN